jgi:hypothetical protein
MLVRFGLGVDGSFYCDLVSGGTPPRSPMQTFISRPVLDPASATDEQIADALRYSPGSCTVETKTYPATDTEGTSILASLNYPSSSRLSGYDYGLNGTENHLAAALQLLAYQEFDAVALLDVESTKEGYRFIFGPENLG